jgi:hypothetical protein
MAGMIWKSVKMRHDQSLLTYERPKPMALQTSCGQQNVRRTKKAEVRLTKASQVPQAVVDGGERSAVLRVNDLGQQHRRGQLTERVAESENESTSAEHCR